MGDVLADPAVFILRLDEVREWAHRGAMDGRVSFRLHLPA